MTLIEFLHARLDEDEQVAKNAPVNDGCIPPAHWTVSTHWADQQRVVMGTADDFALPTPEHATHVARHDPARVLREVQAKRAVLDLRDALTDRRAVLSEYTMRTTHTEAGVESYDHVIQHMAAVYADHPQYQSEWAPQA